MPARRRSSTRWRRRSVSSTGPSSSTGNGGVADSARISASRHVELDLARGEVRVDVALLAAHDRARRRTRRTPRAGARRARAPRRPTRDGRRAGRCPSGRAGRRRSGRRGRAAGAPSRRRARSPRRARRTARRTRRRGSGWLACGAPHSSVPAADVVHDRVRLHRALLSRLHVLERGALVAEDGNVAGTGAVSLLELTLERAAAEFESCRVAGAPRVGGEAERGARGATRPRRRRRGRAARAAVGCAPAAMSMRSTPAAKPMPGVCGPPICSISPS